MGSIPSVSYLSSGSNALAIFIISLHFFGVSSTLPARKRQQHAVSWNNNVHTLIMLKLEKLNLNLGITSEIQIILSHKL